MTQLLTRLGNGDILLAEIWTGKFKFAVFELLTWFKSLFDFLKTVQNGIQAEAEA